MSLKSLFNAWDNVKFGGKMILLCCVTIFIVGGASIVGFGVSLSSCNKLLHEQTAVSLSLLSRQIRLEMGSIEEASRMAALNPEIQRLAERIQSPDIDELERVQARGVINEALYGYLTPRIERISIHFDSQNPVVCGLDSRLEEQAFIDKSISGSQKRNGAGFWATGGQDVVLYVREITKASEPEIFKSLGYLVIRVDFIALVNKAGGAETISIVSESGELFYGEPDSAFIPDDKAFEIMHVGGKTLFVNSATLDTTDPPMSVVIGIDYDDVYGSVIRASAIAFGSVALAILICIACTAIAVKGINHRFERLLERFNRFKSGDFTIDRQNDYARDELGLLTMYFEDMILELKSLINDNYVQRLAISEYKLGALRQQIQPHFLYNTLESIKLFAWRNGEPNIPVIIDALGELLQSGLDDSIDVYSIGDDLKIVNSYLAIQTMRFGDTLSVGIDADDETLDAAIPKMSIQPIVENAINYGMEDSIDICRVMIRSYVRGNDIVVSVSNTGSRIDENILDKLQDGSANASGRGIGLLNIDTRVKLIFGEHYGLAFSNEDGATVEIRLPKGKIRGGEVRDYD